MSRRPASLRGGPVDSAGRDVALAYLAAGAASLRMYDTLGDGSLARPPFYEEGDADAEARERAMRDFNSAITHRYPFAIVGSTDEGPSESALLEVEKLGYVLTDAAWPEFADWAVDEYADAGEPDGKGRPPDGWCVAALALAGVRLMKIPDDVGSPYYRWYLVTEKPLPLPEGLTVGINEDGCLQADFDGPICHVVLNLKAGWVELVNPAGGLVNRWTGIRLPLTGVMAASWIIVGLGGKHGRFLCTEVQHTAIARRCEQVLRRMKENAR